MQVHKKSLMISFAIVALTLPSATTANAGSPTSHSFGLAALSVLHKPRTSTFFSGYIPVTGLSTTTTATMPAIEPGDCTTGDHGVAALSVQFNADGTKYVEIAVFSSCVSGTAYLFVQLRNADGTQINLTDMPTVVGDRIEEIITTEGSTTSVTANNLTQGWTRSLSGSAIVASEDDIGIETIVVDGLPVVPQDFGKAKVTDVVIGTKDLADAKPYKFNCVAADGTVIMKSSKIKKGTDFAITWKNP